jgi:uncharacterized membrane protein YhaH (DUF805 family)
MTNLLFSFEGRINRARFWLVALGIFVAEMIILGILFASLGGGAAMSADPEQAMAAIGGIGMVILAVVVVVATWISLAIGVKRWHDRNKTGWWMLINFVPVIGPFWYLIECGFLKGTSGPNIYGADPLAA